MRRKYTANASQKDATKRLPCDHRSVPILSDSSTHNVNFERLFVGPITVACGDGFTVTVSNGLICLGAMVIDYYVPPPAGTVLVVR